MTIWLGILIATLAAMRLTRLAVLDSITHPIRVRLLAKYGEDGKVGTLLTCPWCIGFWISAALWSAVWWQPSRWLYWVLGCFAVSEVVGLLAQKDKGYE